MEWVYYGKSFLRRIGILGQSCSEDVLANQVKRIGHCCEFDLESLHIQIGFGVSSSFNN